jgi:hypothetical protein
VICYGLAVAVIFCIGRKINGSFAAQNLLKRARTARVHTRFVLAFVLSDGIDSNAKQGRQKSHSQTCPGTSSISDSIPV